VFFLRLGVIPFPNLIPIGKTDVIAVQYRFESPTNFKTFHVQHKPTTAKESNTHSYTFPRRRRRGPRPQESPLPIQDPALLRRKHIYRHKLYSLHIGSNRVSQHKSFTPQAFSRSPELQSRARKWIRRELAVFEFLDPNHPSTPRDARATNAEYLLEFIIAILKAVDIKDSSGQAEELVKEFIGRDNAQLFLHELEAWLRSPYLDLKDWDMAVQYREDITPVPLADEETSGNHTKIMTGPGHERYANECHEERRHKFRGQLTSTSAPNSRLDCGRESRYEAEEFREAMKRFGESFLLTP
jgi:hypothetical protein